MLSLIVAVKNQDLLLVQNILSQCQNIDVMDEYVRCALHYAAKIGSGYMTKILIESGANVNQSDLFGLSALHIAVRHNHPQIVQLLCAKGAFDHYCDSLLYLAAARGFYHVVKVLLDAGVDNHFIVKRSSLPLFESIKRGRIDTLRSLLIGGAPINQIFHNGWSPLTAAVYFNQEDCLKELLEGGVDIEQCDEKSQNGLDIARKFHCHMVAPLVLYQNSYNQIFTELSEKGWGYSPPRYLASLFNSLVKVAYSPHRRLRQSNFYKELCTLIKKLYRQALMYLALYPEMFLYNFRVCKNISQNDCNNKNFLNNLPQEIKFKIFEKCLPLPKPHFLFFLVSKKKCFDNKNSTLSN